VVNKETQVFSDRDLTLLCTSRFRCWSCGITGEG